MNKLLSLLSVLALLLLINNSCNNAAAGSSLPGPASIAYPPHSSTGSAPAYPFLDPSLPTDQRVDDLVGRMTLEEKIGQMMNAAPAIPRLGIPEYNWWNECLHGVARAGLATVFPQAIGLGACWDEGMQFRVATAISDEARAKHHDFVRKGKRLIYEGLTFWSPNINIFRDPRWGRGQETYGEDPYLTGRLAVQFIKGLQGDDPKYFKTIATVKHFAVHSGPEPERHFFDAQADERDFRETYLPQFEMGIKEGKAYSVMCAYNRYHGEACCGSSHLLTTILRNEWNFQGYVVSDCGAIDDIYQHHKIVSTPEEAGALAVRAGCDLECATTYEHLKEAVKKKIISEKEIDVAVKRLFTARFKLGMFDPADKVKWANIPYSVVDSKEHKQLALEAARKSIVLLKNEHNLLPLKKNIGTLAVIGPNADQWQMLLGNYNGLPSKAYTPLEGIREKLSATGSKVLYAQGCELAEGLPDFVKVPAAVLSHGTDKGLQADYYTNKEFTGAVLFSSVDAGLDANWGEGAPRKDMNDDNFGVKWNGTLTPERSGLYQLGIITTCKVNLYLDDSLIANTSYHFRDEFNDPRLRKSVPIRLETGKKYRIRVEAGESYGDARVQLVWSAQKDNAREELKQEALATARQADAVVLCMGLSARLEGEEMDVNVEGFKGGDRTTLNLPKVQEELIRAITALGKPVVLVLLNGSALSVNWEDSHIPAIVEAWYPGQAAGPAIADVLFGDYNPAGRLPVTFYRSLDDLPAFGDYAMAGRTYRYFKGEVLYPFGYGLSYTRFQYDHLEFAKAARRGDTVRVSVNVKNTGSREGDEVAQLYLSGKDATVPVPIRSLRGFKRIHLQPGETKTLHFSIAPDAFTIIDDKMQKVTLPGRFDLSVGGGQPGDRIAGAGPATSNTVKGSLLLQ
ncbi:MAG TPA: glycoside hydrolase family 3 C-terminal domain-containing protein [Puia sp.]|jgi:beta-glucosidase